MSPPSDGHFERAVRVSDFVPHREATGWARGVDDAIDSVEQLMNDGQAAAVIELCESALQSLLGAIQAVDDSDGHFGVLRDRLRAFTIGRASSLRCQKISKRSGTARG